MTNWKKLLDAARNSPNNFRFVDLVALAKSAGFEARRRKGSHLSLTHPRIDDPRGRLTLQERNGQAKAYQVRQVLDLIDEYELFAGRDDV